MGAIKQRLGRGLAKGAEFKQAIVAPKALPDEASHWWWNPNRAGVVFGPDDFRRRLKDFDPELEVTWDAYQERWLMWMVAPKLQSKLCSGWTLLFPVRYEDGSYMPLDERIFARLYGASVRRWGNGRQYFDAIEREWEREKAAAKKASEGETAAGAGEYYDYMKIKNIGTGSKFTNHWQ